MERADHKSNMWAGAVGGGVMYCSRWPNQEPHVLGSHRMDDGMETHTRAPVEQLRLSKSYLVWQGGFCVGVFVTEQLFIGQAALGCCLLFLPFARSTLSSSVV